MSKFIAAAVGQEPSDVLVAVVMVVAATAVVVLVVACPRSIFRSFASIYTYFFPRLMLINWMGLGAMG